MVQSIKENGKMVCHMEKADVFMLMEVLTMEDGKMDSLMDLARRKTLMALIMMGIGSMVRRMEKVLRNQPIILHSKDYGKIASLSKVNVFILISVLMKGLGMMEDLKGKVKEPGKINEDMRVSFMQENHVELGLNFIQTDEKLQDIGVEANFLKELQEKVYQNNKWKNLLMQNNCICNNSENHKIKQIMEKIFPYTIQKKNKIVEKNKNKNKNFHQQFQKKKTKMYSNKSVNKIVKNCEVPKIPVKRVKICVSQVKKNQI